MNKPSNDPKHHLPGFDTLARLQTFDPNAFIANDKQEQKVCDFILALALIFNDLKDME
jgi:hypothetical protein